MTKNEAKIKDGIRALCNRPYELISGTVLSGSVDTEAYTVSVTPSDGAVTIEGVSLNVCSGENNGMILVPEDGSNVVIGTIDGPGEWTVLKASKLAKAIFKAGNVGYEIDSTKISLKNGNVVLDISNSLLKISTASESLYALLNDLLTAISVLTVPTPSGASSTPLNALDFTNLQSRLSNLLSA